MPLPPAACRGRSKAANSGATAPASPGGETPSKIPRPLKRQRRIDSWAWAGCAANSDGGDFVGLALSHSLALLEARDIVQSAMVCRAWRSAAECRALWLLATPCLGLVARIVQRKEISQRRSRGKVERGILLGEFREVVALRTVDLANANAGSDDGLLPSLVREVALLRTLARHRHPGVVRLLGAEVNGKLFQIVTEYVAASFADWFGVSAGFTVTALRSEIRDRFAQLLSVLDFLHGRGIMHRNLTAWNVLLSASGSVKLCDFAFGRALDEPLRPYSPEEPKLRECSSREARRLYYRAPELVLRQSIYGPQIDIWSVGALLAEAALHSPLFPSRCETEHLTRIFRLLGTPGPSYWPRALATPFFSPKFPVYAPVDFTLVPRAACGLEPDLSTLQASLSASRPDVLQPLLRLGAVLGESGLQLLSGLLRLEPDTRLRASEARHSSFFIRPRCWEISSPSSVASESPESAPGSQVSAAMARHRLQGGLREESLLLEMALLDGELRRKEVMEVMEERVKVVDMMVALATKLKLSDSTLHLSVALFDALRQGSSGLSFTAPALAVACLKLGDAFEEHGQEYYQRERCDQYLAAIRQGERTLMQTDIWQQLADFNSAQLIAAEKWVAQHLEFRLHRPTPFWFLQSSFKAGGPSLVRKRGLVEFATYTLNLALLDGPLYALPSLLLAQLALLLALYTSEAAASSTETLGPVSLLERTRLLFDAVRHLGPHGSERAAAEAYERMTLILTRQRHIWHGIGVEAVSKRHPQAARQTAPAGGYPPCLLALL